MENGPVEIVDFPIKNGGSFHCYVSSPEGISHYNPISFPFIWIMEDICHKCIVDIIHLSLCHLYIVALSTFSYAPKLPPAAVVFHTKHQWLVAGTGDETDESSGFPAISKRNQSINEHVG